VAGRFPLYTDADVHGPLVEALIRRGWDVLRAVDAFPEGTQDDLHFVRAAQLKRVMVSCDRDVRRLAVEWLRQGRRFRGLIAWPQEHHARMSVGALEPCRTCSLVMNMLKYWTWRNQRGRPPTSKTFSPCLSYARQPCEPGQIGKTEARTPSSS